MLSNITAKKTRGYTIKYADNHSIVSNFIASPHFFLLICLPAAKAVTASEKENAGVEGVVSEDGGSSSVSVDKTEISSVSSTSTNCGSSCVTAGDTELPLSFCNSS